LRVNENIFTIPAVSTIEIKGQTNHYLLIMYPLRFEGVANTAIINSPKSPPATSLLSFG
jgi:hypothetical protein